MWSPDPSIIQTAEQRKRAADDEAWRVLRIQRDQLLAQCDWTQMPDAPVDHEAWAKYRQQLRDLTKSTKDPKAVTWPQPPSKS